MQQANTTLATVSRIAEALGLEIRLSPRDQWEEIAPEGKADAGERDKMKSEMRTRASVTK